MDKIVTRAVLQEFIFF